MFAGNKLTLMREINGLTRSQLAKQVEEQLDIEFSEQNVHMIENNLAMPNFQQVMFFADKFKVPAKFFFNQSDIPNVCPIQHIAFRSKKNHTVESESKYINFVSNIIHKTEQYIGYPKPIIKDLKFESISIYNEYSDKNKALKLIAENARKKLMVSDDNEDLMFRLEYAGIYIIEKDLGESDAYSVWTKDDDAFIVLCNREKQAVRRNFSLVHELGHLLFHWFIDMQVLEAKEYQAVEKEANIFASYFLLPEEKILPDLNKIINLTNPDEYIELKRKYQVSISALAMRADSLGLMKPDEKRIFFRNIALKGYRKIEPLDEIIPIIYPSRIQSFMSFIVKDDILTFNELLDEYSLDKKAIETYFSFNKEFFDQIDMQNKIKKAKTIKI